MRTSYPTYKSTSIPWLPEMPEHWEQRKNKYLFRRSKSLVGKDFEKYPVLSLTMNGVIRRDLDNPMGKMPATFADYQLIQDNTLLFCLFDYDVTPRTVGMVNEKGIVSPAYTSMYPVEKIDLKYYYYWFLMLDERKMLLTHVTNLRNSVSYETFAGLFSPFPPLPEQTAIANYLDAKSEQINRFIAKKEKLIALLKEQKPAVINELLEDKEGKWERRKLRHAIKGKLKYGANESGISYNPEYPRYIRITDFGSDGKLRNDDMLSLLPSVAKDYILKDGDILFARSGGTVGKTFQYKKSDADASLSCYAGYLIKAEPNEKVILSDFLYIYTLSGHYEQWKQGIFNKATIENIGADKYSQLLIPVPPIETQKLILSNINSETTKIDDAILRIEREIEKVKELKQSLIAEVVTGKIKVA